MTEQGEVVSAKYANRGTAHYQVELLAASACWSTCLTSRARATRLVPRARVRRGDGGAVRRGLGDLPPAWSSTRRCCTYLRGASPLEELALLNIGSRPARRGAAPRTLADLRAIPWVFAWSQNRHMVPGWYGLGSALEAFVEVRKAQRAGAAAAHVRASARLFRTVIDEVEKTLLTVDLSIAAEYARLVPDAHARDACSA